MNEEGPLSAEVLGWIAAVERLAVANAGAPLEPQVAGFARGLGAGLVFYKRAQAQGHPQGIEASEQFLARLEPLARAVGLTLQELRDLRPLGVA